MSVGNKLNEMENIEENVVTKGAAPAEPMQKLSTGGIPPNVEDLGGPTPENYKPDNDSDGDKYPRSCKTVSSNIAVTSILNNSVINMTIPDPKMARTIAIEPEVILMDEPC